MMISSIPVTARTLPQHGVAFAPQIARAAAKSGVDPRLLAAVAAQETGGPGSNAGRNIVGDGGHGHGIFQIDDRFHRFANTPSAMDPQANADYAAGMLAGLLKQYGGDVRKALSAYNAGAPDAHGTVTSWQDGQRLGYADSVLRHYAALADATSSRDGGSNPLLKEHSMHLSLGGLIKGVTSGLETLVETGNPAIAAGAGALGFLSGNSGQSPAGPVQTFDPLLDEMSANLNPGTPSNTYSYAQLAGTDAQGKSRQNDPYGGVSLADLVD